MTAGDVYGMQLRVSFDATELEFQAAGSLHNDVSAAGWFWDTVPENFIAVAGGQTALGQHRPRPPAPDPATLTGQSVATWKFKRLKAGTWNLTYDQTPKWHLTWRRRMDSRSPTNWWVGRATVWRRRHR